MRGLLRDIAVLDALLLLGVANHPNDYNDSAFGKPWCFL